MPLFITSAEIRLRCAATDLTEYGEFRGFLDIGNVFIPISSTVSKNQSLPWESSFEEIDQDVAHRLQVIPSTQLKSTMRINGTIATGGKSGIIGNYMRLDILGFRTNLSEL